MHMHHTRYAIALGLGAIALNQACTTPVDLDDERTGESTSALTGTSTDRVLKLNRRGIVDTDVALTEFATAPHTVSLWVMPEFTFAGNNDLLVSNASSSNNAYAIGIDNYRSGNGAAGLVGDPVLFLRVGSKQVRFLAPGFTKRTWHHLAIKRVAGGFGTTGFYLYLDGIRLVPKVITKVDANGDDDLQPSEVTVANAPQILFTSGADAPPTFSTGKLRFGPRAGTLNYFYGLVDDARVYTRAMTDAEIASMAELGATPPATDLLASFHFNASSLSGPSSPQPSPSQRTYALAEQPWAKLVKRISRTSPTADAAIIDDPEHIGPSEATYRLPFGANQIWRVAQGYDAPSPSHNGKSAAFSIDLVRDDASSTSANVQAAASGKLVAVADYQGLTENRERNYFRLQVAPTEGLTYLHMQEGFSVGYGLGASTPQPDDPSSWWPVTTGASLGKYGENAKHLHIASTNEHTSSDFRPMPVAFVEYWVETASGWKWVARGQPKTGQRIKR